MKTAGWLALLACLPGLAAPAEFGCERADLRVDFHPFGLAYWRDAGGQRQGTDVELLNALAQETGCNFAIGELSRVLIWKKLQTGQTDLVLSALPTPERDQWGHFIALPYWENRNQLVISKQLPKPASMAELLAYPALRLGVVRGYRYGDTQWDTLIAHQRSQGRLVEVADLETVYRLFKLGRINALISTPMTYRLLLPRHGLQKLADTVDWSPGAPPLRSGIYLSRQRFSPAELARWDALLGGPFRERFKAILTRYLGPEPEARPQ